MDERAARSADREWAAYDHAARAALYVVRRGGKLVIGAILVSALAGALSALFWVGYLYAVRDRRPLGAAAWDALILASSLVTIQAWGDAGQAPGVLAARVVGSALATYLVVVSGMTVGSRQEGA